MADPALLEQLLQNVSLGLPVEQLLEPLLTQVQQVVAVASIVAGGLFGLSLISFFIRFYHDRKILKELRQLRKDVAELRGKK